MDSVKYIGMDAVRYRAQWLGKISEAGVHRRAEFYYQQFDALRVLRQEVRRELLAEAEKHEAWKLLRQIPFIGPIRAALADRSDPDPTPLPHQAPAVDLQRVWDRDAQQCRASIRPGRAARDHGTEGENNPAQWGGLDGKKNSGRRRSVFSLTPFMELTRT
jgi:hypothetical protein